MHTHFHIHVQLHTYKRTLPTSNAHAREATINEPRSLKRDREENVVSERYVSNIVLG